MCRDAWPWRTSGNRTRAGASSLSRWCPFRSAQRDAPALDRAMPALDLVEHALGELDAGQLAAVHQAGVDAEFVRQIDHHPTHRSMAEHHRRVDFVRTENGSLERSTPTRLSS